MFSRPPFIEWFPRPHSFLPRPFLPQHHARGGCSPALNYLITLPFISLPPLLISSCLSAFTFYSLSVHLLLLYYCRLTPPTPHSSSTAAADAASTPTASLTQVRQINHLMPAGPQVFHRYAKAIPTCLRLWQLVLVGLSLFAFSFPFNFASH